ncbi:hypothetical protein HY492_03555 [Candidatus Woesearchaeota archaeon]|nr:hypothetical protein [Candidatus Woesearchaeota archaeon]
MTILFVCEDGTRSAYAKQLFEQDKGVATSAAVGELEKLMDGVREVHVLCHKNYVPPALVGSYKNVFWAVDGPAGDRVTFAEAQAKIAERMKTVFAQMKPKESRAGQI